MTIQECLTRSEESLKCARFWAGKRDIERAADHALDAVERILRAMVMATSQEGARG